MKRHVIIRCNLTILLEKRYEKFPQFYTEHGLEVIASLPYYSQRNVDSQRGKGTFQKSIKSLQQLNQLGYGKDGSELKLNLVYNPAGAFLAPTQDAIEKDFKYQLKRK